MKSPTQKIAFGFSNHLKTNYFMNCQFFHKAYNCMNHFPWNAWNMSVARMGVSATCTRDCSGEPTSTLGVATTMDPIVECAFTWNNMEFDEIHTFFTVSSISMILVNLTCLACSVQLCHDKIWAGQATWVPKPWRRAPVLDDVDTTCNMERIKKRIRRKMRTNVWQCIIIAWQISNNT